MIWHGHKARMSEPANVAQQLINYPYNRSASASSRAGGGRREKMSKKVVINKKMKKDLIWASGHFLCNHLPNDFDTWTERKLNNYLEKYIVEHLQGCDADWIWEQIDDLAYSVHEYKS